MSHDYSSISSATATANPYSIYKKQGDTPTQWLVSLPFYILDLSYLIEEAGDEEVVLGEAVALAP